MTLQGFKDWMVDTITVRPYGGEGADGPVLGDPQEVPGVMVVYRERLVRGPNGDTRASDAQVLADEDRQGVLAAGGEVTLPDGRVRTILQCQAITLVLPQCQAVLV